MSQKPPQCARSRRHIHCLGRPHRTVRRPNRAQHRPPKVPPARRGHRRRVRARRRHRQGRRDTGRRRNREPPGRRARRRPDAGEPFLRPLLRHPARRPRLRRPPPGRPAQRKDGLPPGGLLRARDAALPAGRRQPGPAVHPGPRPQLVRHPPGMERRQLRPLDSRQGHHHDGVPHPRGHPLPLRPRRRVHHLRRVPLLDAQLHRPQPLLHVHRLHGQRRQGRRPGAGQRGGRLRLDHLPGDPGAGGRLLEGLPGRRHRPGRRRRLGLDQRRLHRQLR